MKDKNNSLHSFSDNSKLNFSQAILKVEKSISCSFSVSIFLKPISIEIKLEIPFLDNLFLNFIIIFSIKSFSSFSSFCSPSSSSLLFSSSRLANNDLLLNKFFINSL